MTTPDTTTRPLRADAQRNRDKIVAAARDCFSEDGLDAQMEDVARRAGVGVGTVYRHFPTKDALVRALVVAQMEAMTARGPEFLEILKLDVTGQILLREPGAPQQIDHSPGEMLKRLTGDFALLVDRELVAKRDLEIVQSDSVPMPVEYRNHPTQHLR